MNNRGVLFAIFMYNRTVEIFKELSYENRTGNFAHVGL